MSNRRRHVVYPVERLGDAEAARAREVLRERGLEKSLRFFGLSDGRTLYKALAQDNVSRLTAICIRTALERKDTL